jgi:hypothetical protein
MRAQEGEGEEETETQSEDTNSMRNFRNEIGKRRQYLKEIIVSHPLWQEGRFWEQALWQCVLEQVGTEGITLFTTLSPFPSHFHSLSLSFSLFVCPSLLTAANDAIFCAMARSLAKHRESGGSAKSP